MPSTLIRGGMTEPMQAANGEQAQAHRLTRRESDSGSVEGHLCSHCGLPVARGDVVFGSPLQFCCYGCRTVYEVLQSSGLSEYYALRERATAEKRRASATCRSYEAFDDERFRAMHCRPIDDGLLQVELYLEGVHCAACVWLVERVALIVPGSVRATLDIGRSIVTLVYDPDTVKLSELGRALDRLGYPPHAVRGADALLLRRKEQRTLLLRIGVAAACAGNAMLMALALYSGSFSGMDAEYVALFRWGSLLVTLPAVLWSASPFFKGALAAVRVRTAHMDLPIAIGILAGFTGGVIATISGRGEVYFDTITVLIFLLLVGRWIQLRQQDMARSAAELLYSLAPSEARRIDPDGTKLVPADTLLPGDRIEVLASEHVPADGIVVEGYSAIDTSLLTGEPIPELAGVGAVVCAGTTNLRAPLVLRVERAGLDTRIAKLMKSVEEAGRRRARVVRLADRISSWFSIAVLVAAALTFAAWSLVDVHRGFENAIALLVVTCPCALGMATPLAVTAALGRAARRGVLVKGGDALEALARAELVVFDKTGTLTEGKLKLVAWEGDESVKSSVRAIERLAVHPVAQAMVRALGNASDAGEVTDLVNEVGGGVAGTVSGVRYVIGSPRFHVERGHLLPPSITAAFNEHVALGRTPVLVSRDGEIVALAAFEDPLRGDTTASLERLRALGFSCAILSGDHDEAVKAVAARLGLPFKFVKGSSSPESKLALVESLTKEQTVVMVGDGVNDAGALSAATVGVAVHGGAEASLSAADAFSTEPGLGKVVELVEGSRRTLKVIRRGLAFSLLYNLIGTALAMMGWLNPLVAAVLMPLSSLTVVTNAFRSKTFE
ncbi:MAG: heavy metal translocating P-type ATPase [Polyangiaceae bacterium]